MRDAIAIARALANATERLGAGGIDDPRASAEILLAHALKQSRTALKTWPENALTPEQVQTFERLIKLREAGEPVAYLTGTREFWSLELRVTRATLIPRPETECLVEAALKRIPPGATWHIADLGTGSGAIALALARERPACRLVAVDISTEALSVARDNARALNIANVEFCAGRWLEPLAGRRFDMIVSNPPYLADSDAHLERGDLRFEPRSALSCGVDGLAALREIAGLAPRHLSPSGWLLVEHGIGQHEDVATFFQKEGFRDVEHYQDLAGIARGVVGQR